jgi:hypothetical protein
MDTISITGTSKTPSVEFNSEKGMLEIKGRSNPEDSKIFYRPLINWVDDYVSHPPDKTTVVIQLEHFNTISSKSLLDLFKRLKTIINDQKQVEVNWYYEKDDEDLLDAGKNYEHITGIPFTMIPC